MIDTVYHIGYTMTHQEALCEKLESTEWPCEVLLDYLAKQLANEYVQLTKPEIRNQPKKIVR